jgi:hypothetical protein
VTFLIISLGVTGELDIRSVADGFAAVGRVYISFYHISSVSARCRKGIPYSFSLIPICNFCFGKRPVNFEGFAIGKRLVQRRADQIIRYSRFGLIVLCSIGRRGTIECTFAESYSR